MPTSQEIRNIRLKNDYREMCNIRGQIITWRAVEGTPPYVEAYLLRVNVRSIIGKGPDYRDHHDIYIELPANYPAAPPKAEMVSDPVVFHPNWWTDKRWCYGTWDISEGLGHYVIRMIRTLQFDPAITNEDSPANIAAKDWYLSNRRLGIFPCDLQVLPDPERSKNETQPGVRKKFQVQR
jgi:ubiquitin-protein ligase